MGEYSNDPYPEVDDNPLVVILPFALLFGILFFEFSGTYGQSNPIFIFAIPLLFAISFQTRKGIENFLDTFGIYFTTLKDKLVALGGSVLGGITGYGMYSILTLRMAVIPFAMLPLSQSGLGTPVYIVAFYFVISTGEEFAGFYNSKVFANWFSDKGWFGNRLADIIVGSAVARVFWASAHAFSYGLLVANGIDFSVLPLFVICWSLGMVFSCGAIFLGELTERKELFGSFALAAHLVFNVFVAMHLSFLA